jgi:hypothetical protein
MAMSPRLLRPRASGYVPVDADARTYVSAVKTADGQSLESNVAKAIDVFVRGCKTDGTWNAMTHCALLAGPRTIAGCCVALKGTSPTSNAFVSSDYTRKTGLKGSTSNTKFLNTNVNHNTFTQNDFHMGVWISESPATNTTKYNMGAGGNQTGASALWQTSTALQYQNQTSAAQSPGINTDSTTGMIGCTRSTSTTFTMRWGSVSGGAGTRTSQVPYNGNIHVFRDSFFSTQFSDARLAWYSMGANIDFALLRARLTTYLADIAAALP